MKRVNVFFFFLPTDETIETAEEEAAKWLKSEALGPLLLTSNQPAVQWM